MNVPPLGGVLGSAAGSQLQQTRGSDKDRAAQDVGSQQTADKLGAHADRAAGVGQAEEDQGASERDADCNLDHGTATGRSVDNRWLWIGKLSRCQWPLRAVCRAGRSHAVRDG